MYCIVCFRVLSKMTKHNKVYTNKQCQATCLSCQVSHFQLKLCCRPLNGQCSTPALTGRADAVVCLQLENVAIANALQLEAARAPSVLPALITTPCQVRSRWTDPLPYYSVYAADTLLYAVTSTFDLWTWTFAVYRLWRDKTLYQIWMQCNRAIRGGVIAISVFDLMTLNITLRVALGSWIIFTKFDLRQLISAWILSCFNANTLRHAVALTFDLLTLKFLQHFGVMRLNSVQNLSEIE